jgi:hypothetical protein
VTKAELVARLIRENVPSDSYSLDGGLPNDRYCLQQTFDGWEIYYTEMGKRYDVRHFNTEVEACDYLYIELMHMLRR